MASMSLYPPIVDSSMPAFNVNKPCTIYYSLSKFNSTIDIRSIHISVVYQKDGVNAVNKSDDELSNNPSEEERNQRRFRKSGIIIINQSPTPVQGETNLYSIDIRPEDLLKGWSEGDLYKIQLRFSSKEYDTREEVMPEHWLSENANEFSEWSTICVVKPIGKIRITIPIFSFDSSTSDTSVNETTQQTLFTTTLDFHGSYSCSTVNEYLYSYRVVLYSDVYDIIEDSGILYTNDYYDSNQFKYLFKTELLNGEKYHLRFSFITEHDYEETLEDFTFIISASGLGRPDFTIITLENDVNELLKGITTLQDEEDEGRIGIKIYDKEKQAFSGNICIRRTDSKSNFTKWEDIKIIVFKQEIVNEKEPFFDYTIESGVWYKYGLQALSVTGLGEIERGQMYEMPEYIIRNFNYSYLLGNGGVQLKLKYNNDMSSYKININESKLDTIGGIYPFITRNGNTNYRTFPINGLISFNMDENNVFTNEKEVYNDNTITGLITQEYKNYNNKNNITQYDYTYERFFREKVLKFLHDGKPKLFKSPTEGNIIIRLMDLNEAPQQSLSRLIYSFSGTAHEVAEANLENYAKYGFFNVGAPTENFFIYDTKIGQIIGDFAFGENICERIWKKYDSQGQNYAGYSLKLGAIKYLRIEINSQPFRITNNSKTGDTSITEMDYTLGNNINYNGKVITIYGDKQVYEFDSLLTFTKNDNISFLGPNDSLEPDQVVNATIDFIYDITKDVYVAKRIKSQTISNGIGQYYENTTAETSIFNVIFYKYYREWQEKFCRLSRLTSVEIEATPGTVFLIKDETDSVAEYHDIGPTGVLRLDNLSDIKELKFIGFRQSDGTIQSKVYIETITKEDGTTEDIYENVASDILVNYFYILTKGEYLKDES